MDFKLSNEISFIDLYSDRSRIMQILINLVGNAVKFTSYGSVTISAVLKHRTSLELSVEDTGQGIREDDQKVLFQMFSRVN